MIERDKRWTKITILFKLLAPWFTMKMSREDWRVFWFPLGRARTLRDWRPSNGTDHFVELGGRSSHGTQYEKRLLNLDIRLAISLSAS